MSTLREYIFWSAGPWQFVLLCMNLRLESEILQRATHSTLVCCLWLLIVVWIVVGLLLDSCWIVVGLLWLLTVVCFWLLLLLLILLCYCYCYVIVIVTVHCDCLLLLLLLSVLWLLLCYRYRWRCYCYCYCYGCLTAWGTSLRHASGKIVMTVTRTT